MNKKKLDIHITLEEGKEVPIMTIDTENPREAFASLCAAVIMAFDLLVDEGHKTREGEEHVLKGLRDSFDLYFEQKQKMEEQN